jgi:hypothetical protein
MQILRNNGVHSVPAPLQDCFCAACNNRLFFPNNLARDMYMEKGGVRDSLRKMHGDIHGDIAIKYNSYSFPNIDASCAIRQCRTNSLRR